MRDSCKKDAREKGKKETKIKAEMRKIEERIPQNTREVERR